MQRAVFAGVEGRYHSVDYDHQARLDGECRDGWRGDHVQWCLEDRCHWHYHVGPLIAQAR